MANKKFTINVEMEERWVVHFMSMLAEMESLGNMGSSTIVGMYADGDGDFRPKFETDIECERKEPKDGQFGRIYDAG